VARSASRSAPGWEGPRPQDVTADLIDEGACRGQERSCPAMTNENRRPAGGAAGYHLCLA
jgi:hypothetical protein